MHGIKRARVPPAPDTAEVERKKLEQEARRITTYRNEVDDLYNKGLAQDYSEEALNCSTTVLRLNPEFQSGWSARRRILLGGALQDPDPATRQALLENDLALTFESLLKNPKNYSVWEHRKWLLETMPDADWGREMKMVDVSLQKDGRNFHSWDYRRYLVASIAALDPMGSSLRIKALPDISTSSELAFTTRKISANFSNFSAWHYRSKLLPKYWEEKSWSEGSSERKEHVDEEFELVKQAMWSDPDDQSAWLYHRWLAGTGNIQIIRREITGIEELLSEEPNSRWCLDSLVFYKRLLSQLLLQSAATESVAERLSLNSECSTLLTQLEVVDPSRTCRYLDLRSS